MAIARNQPRRVAAFIYGNILILTALVVLDPVDLSWPKVVAYVLAESIVFQVRTMQPIAAKVVVHELRNSVPILSAITVPALLTSASLLGWLDPDVALPVAISWIVLRIAALGWVVGHPTPRARLGADVPVLRAAGAHVPGSFRPEMVAHALNGRFLT